MARGRGNRSRQNSKARSSRATIPKPAPAVPAPKPPPAPRPSAAATPVRRGLPPNSAQARAQRWGAAMGGALDGATDRWASILAPTPEARAERDRNLSTQVVEDLKQQATKPELP